jgi:Tetratricopeptide repeat
LSREEFDSIEFDAAASGNYAAAARQMTQLAATGTETAGMPRAEAYLRAGEQWLLADDPAEAVAGFQRAMADGGPVFVDPRVPMARALFQLGRHSEAQNIISQLKAEGPADPRACDLVAELLVERSELAAALEWTTAGVELCLAGRAEPEAATAVLAGDDQASAERDGDSRHRDEAELRLLLRLRYRIRNDLGLPEDDYDAMLDDA